MSRLNEIGGRLEAATQGRWGWSVERNLDTKRATFVLLADSHEEVLRFQTPLNAEPSHANRTILATATWDIAHLLSIVRVAQVVAWAARSAVALEEMRDFYGKSSLALTLPALEKALEGEVTPDPLGLLRPTYDKPKRDFWARINRLLGRRKS